MFNLNQLLPPIPQGKDVITYSVRINGKPIPDNFVVTTISTYRCFNRIPHATLQLLDSEVATQKLETSDQDLLSPGNPIEILAGYSKIEEIIFSGIIINHCIKIKGQKTPELKIVCKDLAVRLTVERKNNYFLNDTDQGIIESIIRQDEELDDNIAETLTEHQEMVQYHATDWDFIITRAEANAHLVEARDGEIISRPPDFEGEAKLVLNYGSSIFEFEAEMDARDQYPLAKASSWDYSKQELLEVQADDGGVSVLSGGGIGGAFGAATSAISTVAGAVGVSLPGAPPNTDYRESLGVKQQLNQHSGKLSQQELEGWAAAQY